MRRSSSLLLMSAALLASLSLAACGSDDDAKPDATKSAEKETPEVSKKNKIKTAMPICPQVAVVRGLDVVSDFGTEISAPNQLVAAGKMLGIEGDCEYTDEGIDVRFTANMAFNRGPRLGGTHTSFPIFVAVVDPAGKILNKNQMTVDVSFSGKDPVAMQTENLHVFVPMPKSQHMQGPNYKILAGFQLSPAQADQAKAAMKP